MINLKENKISSKIVYKGSLLDVRRDVVLLPNGKQSSREWINHPGAVCIIPVLPNGQLALIRQFRYPIRKEMIELPAGKLDPNELPEKCALRELEEETGYNAQEITLLTHIHPAIGFANEIMWLFLAEKLIETKINRDEDEFLELIPTNLEDAIKMTWNGKITDVKTIIGIHWAKRLLS
jgi:ADP-ribose pyrophosphatase